MSFILIKNQETPNMLLMAIKRQKRRIKIKIMIFFFVFIPCIFVLHKSISCAINLTRFNAMSPQGEEGEAGIQGVVGKQGPKVRGFYGCLVK